VVLVGGRMDDDDEGVRRKDGRKEGRGFRIYIYIPPRMDNSPLS
jgi:hypothetical protein